MAQAQANVGIMIERPTEQRLETLKVASWPVWTKEPSTFPWQYDEREMCYLLEGSATVKAAGGTVSIRAGDLVTFPQGLSCTWHVHHAIRKHYRFG